MQHQCVTCNDCFDVVEEDMHFYEKFDIGVPNQCPSCRARQRLLFRNERVFYHRPCDKCKQPVISMYSPNKPYTVWCSDCWNADDWGGEEYARDYDSSRPFIEQFRELFQIVPKVNLMHVRSVNSQYLNICADSKNCYMIVESSNNEDSVHCYWIQQSRDLVDCSFTNKVERSYESDDCYDSYGLQYSRGCHSCTDSAFLLDCRGCTDCIGCVNLRNKSYYIFNEPYSKEEYEKLKKEFRLDTHSGVEALREKFQEFLKNQPRKFAEVVQTVNSTGNYLANVKNVQDSFHCFEAEDCKYCVHSWRTSKDNMDCDTVGRVATNNYNCINTAQESSHNKVGAILWGTSFTEYSYHCLGSQNLFGCVGLRQKKYSILNKQYTKEEYEKLRSEIISQLKTEGIYGEFFPASLSCFGYNESAAIEQFPLTKEEALAQGFKWEDTPRGTYGKETKAWSDVPDSILDLDFDATKEIFVCESCTKNYKIVGSEFLLYQKLSIPLPHLCPDCRHTRRFLARGPNKIWHAKCKCQNSAHMHGDSCVNEFETPYSPDSAERICCEQCYQQEVI